MNLEALAADPRLRVLLPVYRARRNPMAGLLTGAAAPTDHLLSSTPPALFARPPQMRGPVRPMARQQAAAEPAPQPQGPGFLNALGQIFSGPQDPNLTPEQNAMAAQQARMQAGLAMVLASRGGLAAPGFGQILAHGALAGQQAGQMSRQELVQAQQAAAQVQAIAQQLGLPPEVVAAHIQAGTLDNLISQGHGAPAAQPTATVQRGGVTVSGLPVDQAVPTLNTLPEEPPEELTPYQREQVRLAEERLAWDKMKAQADQANGDPAALRREYAGDPIVRQSADIAQSYQRVLSSARNPSAAGDLALIFNYMKMLDPGSVVREGEFATAQNAGGIPERVRAMYNRTIDGTRLDPNVRADFVQRSAMIAEGQRRLVQGVAQRYSALAQQYGLPPGAVIYDPFSYVDVAGGGAVPPPVPQPGTMPADGAGLFDDLVPRERR